MRSPGSLGRAYRDPLFSVPGGGASASAWAAALLSLTLFACGGSGSSSAGDAGAFDGSLTAEAGSDGAPEVDAGAADGALPSDGAATDGRGAPADGAAPDAAIACAAADWYVDAVHGSDTRDGKSLATAFATIQHAAEVAKAGQTVNIEAGTYRETVVPASSGASGKPITFRGCGPVTVSGADPITSAWTPSSGSIYKTAVTLPITGYATKLTGNTTIVANQIFVGSDDATMKMMVEARWPNLASSDDLLNMKDIRQACGFSEDDAGANPRTVVLSDPGMSATAAGGGLVGATIWWGGWFENHTGTVTASSTGTASFTFNDTGDGLGTSCSNESFAQWYYLVGKLALLDAEKEWSYDGTSLYLWAPGGTSPADVKYKARNYAFDLTGKSYVTLSNLSIVAATVVTDAQSQGITIDGIQARYVSHHVALESWPSGPPSGIRLEGPNSVIKNSSVQYSAGFGIVLGASGNTAENNWVSDVDYAGTYDCGISPAAHPVNILHNTIRRSGRSSVDGFKNDTISYNDLSAYGALNPDLGALYTCCSIDSTGSSIDHNVIHDQMAP